MFIPKPSQRCVHWKTSSNKRKNRPIILISPKQEDNLHAKSCSLKRFSTVGKSTTISVFMILDIYRKSKTNELELRKTVNTIRARIEHLSIFSVPGIFFKNVNLLVEKSIVEFPKTPHKS